MRASRLRAAAPRVAPVDRRSAPAGHRSGHPTRMNVALIARTVVLVAWAASLLIHAGPGARTGALALAMALIWAAPLVRDELRARRSAPAWQVDRSRPA